MSCSGLELTALQRGDYSKATALTTKLTVQSRFNVMNKNIWKVVFLVHLEEFPQIFNDYFRANFEHWANNNYHNQTTHAAGCTLNERLQKSPTVYSTGGEQGV